MRIALATAEDFPGLDPDDAPRLDALGDDVQPAVWSDPSSPGPHAPPQAAGKLAQALRLRN